MSYKLSGKEYAMMFGPTTGDKVRLADTDLLIEIVITPCTASFYAICCCRGR